MSQRHVYIKSKTGATYNYYDVCEHDMAEMVEHLPDGWKMTITTTIDDLAILIGRDIDYRHKETTE